MPVRLFVGNLPYDATEAELRELFSAVGPVTYLSLPLDRETGRPRGFAFLEFGERAQAEEAIRRFHQQPFNGRPLAVSEARERDDRRPASAAGAPARSPLSRPPTSRPASTAAPESGQTPGPGGKPSRDFGPDSSSQRQRSKGKGGPKAERAPKGPMREVVSSRFHSSADDYDDDYDDDNDNDNDDLNDEAFNGDDGWPEEPGHPPATEAEDEK